MDIQTLYQKTILFAAEKHKTQKVPGTDLTYLVHLSNVAMEVLIASNYTAGMDLSFAVQLALLHDTIEDTETTFEEIETNFGSRVATGVNALTKNACLPKRDSMIDSLKRIKQHPKEVWAVKLADRITNLQKPPGHWNNEKKLTYLKEAELILNELSEGNIYLAERLRIQNKDYKKFVS